MAATQIPRQEKSSMREAFSLGGATGPLVGLLLLCVFLTVMTDSFLSFRNFLNILDQITVLGIMAVGMTFVILIGGIDLSVGSVMALAMMVLGYLNVEAGMPMILALSGALVVAGLAGAASGFLITEFKVPAFIATLAMMSIARGLANMITDGSQIIGFPAWFNMSAIIRYGGFLTLTVAVMLILSIVTIGPLVLNLIGYSFEGAGPGGIVDTVELLVRMFVAGMLVTIVYTALSMGVSSLTDRRAWASAGIVVLMILSSVVPSLLVDAADMSDQLMLLNLLVAPLELVVRIYGDTPEFPELSTASLVGACAAWVVLGFATAVAKYRNIGGTR